MRTGGKRGRDNRPLGSRNQHAREYREMTLLSKLKGRCRGRSLGLTGESLYSSKPKEEQTLNTLLQFIVQKKDSKLCVVLL